VGKDSWEEATTFSGSIPQTTVFEGPIERVSGGAEGRLRGGEQSAFEEVYLMRCFFTQGWAKENSI